MFEFLEKIIKSEDIFPSINIDFSEIKESILSIGDIFSKDTIENLESLSLFKIESVDDIEQKIIDSKIEIPESQIQKIIEYIKSDPIILEKITQGINLSELVEIIKEKKDLIFTESENFLLPNDPQKIIEKENFIFQKIKEFIPSEYFETLTSIDNNILQYLKKDLTVQIQNAFGDNEIFSNINFENVSNNYFQNIIDNIENTNIQKSFFNDFQNLNLENLNSKNIEILNTNIEQKKSKCF